MKITIVGCGISGVTAAVLLKEAGHAVEIYETRDHVGGNCYDRDEGGVTQHVYGPHLFHTSDREVWEFLGRFTKFDGYRHRVVADTRLGRVAIPYSLRTEAQIGRALGDEEIRELIFTQYSAKQWGVAWDELPATIRNRVPKRRDDFDERYFTDEFQGQPVDGYTSMFGRMLEGIPVHLGAAPDAWRRRNCDVVIYCGKVDAFYGFAHGRLPYRSLRFEHERTRERLGHAVINQCNELPFTRVYDHAYFSGQSPEETLVTREFPCEHTDENVPYYPMPFGEGRERYAKYRAMAQADAESGRVVMLGRLATYAYLDMWMAVAQAMVKVRGIVEG